MALEDTSCRPGGCKHHKSVEGCEARGGRLSMLGGIQRGCVNPEKSNQGFASVHTEKKLTLLFCMVTLLRRVGEQHHVDGECPGGRAGGAVWAREKGKKYKLGNNESKV